MRDVLALPGLFHFHKLWNCCSHRRCRLQSYARRSPLHGGITNHYTADSMPWANPLGALLFRGQQDWHLFNYARGWIPEHMPDIHHERALLSTCLGISSSLPVLALSCVLSCLFMRKFHLFECSVCNLLSNCKKLCPGYALTARHSIELASAKPQLKVRGSKTDSVRSRPICD